MKLGFKKLLAITLVTLLVVFSLPTEVFAQTEEIFFTEMQSPERFGVEMEHPELYGSADDGISVMSVEEDESYTLTEYLFEQFKYCPEYIDISDYYIPCTNENMAILRVIIWYYMPELFHVDMIGFSYRGDYLISVRATYYEGMNTYETYMPKYIEMETAANKLLNGIENNFNLSDVEKALLLHDRLADWNEYDSAVYTGDTVPQESHTAYGALANRVSVCDGYAKGYMFMLNRAGVENDFCISNEMNHAWNIVYIDGVPYHVDVTHDDFDLAGRVAHDNFLVSTEAYRNSSEIHDVSDLESSPQDTTYDNYFWQNSTTVFQLVDGVIYYLDNEEEALKKYENGVSTKLADLLGTSDWTYYYSGYPYNQSCLSSVGDELLYTGSDEVYSYNTKTKENKKLYTTVYLSYDENIYGFAYENGYLTCYITDDLDTYKIQKKLYDIQAPATSMTATNNVAFSQTVTIYMYDEVGISGYYWGQNSSYSSNTFIGTSEETATQTVIGAGTYYLTVKDIGGNLSETYSITFYKTTLNANGGNVSPKSVLTMSGNSFTFPTATKDGYTYEGWATSASAENGVTTLTPTKNSTYYAVWQVAHGDVDGDAAVTAADLVTLEQYLLGISAIDAVESADMNEDGVIDAADLIIIQNLILSM